MVFQDFDKITTIVVLVLTIVFLILDKVKPSNVFFIGIVILVLLDVITIPDFLGAYTNESIISIFLLIFITSGIRDNFEITKYLNKFFGKNNTHLSFTFKLTSSVAALSSLMNNTPIVAMLIPYIQNWSKKNNISPSKLYIPLSFAAIMGGMITVIGTSTNLVLNGMLNANNETPLGFIDFFIPGVLVSTVGIIFLTLFSRKLLPNNPIVATEVNQNKKSYFIETILSADSNTVGKTVSEAKLRSISGLFLVEINRHKQIISPVLPYEILEANDILIFVGDTNKVIDLLHKRKDLHQFKGDNGVKITGDDIMEVVIPSNSNLAGKTIKESHFRANYDAIIFGVHRNGEKLSGQIANITLRYGDLLLLIMGKTFANKTENDQNIYVVSKLDKTKIVSRKKKVSFLILSGMIISLGVYFDLKLFEILLLLLILMFSFKFLTVKSIKKHFDIQLLVVLASAVTLGKTLIETGLSGDMSIIYSNLFAPYGLFTMLVGMYFLTLILTSFVTNIAAVSIVFPLAYSISHELGIDATSFYLAIAFAASAAFLTPVSYQTNLMVYGPGSYKFRDFVKIGVPITILYSITILSYIAIKYNMIT